LCQDVFVNTNDNEKKTKRLNSNGKNTRAEGWQVGVRDDATVEGDILKGEKEEATRQFSICVEKKFRASDEKAHVT
jgi:hypothetical protein